jgi:hypothetical protein
MSISTKDGPSSSDRPIAEARYIRKSFPSVREVDKIAYKESIFKNVIAQSLSLHQQLRRLHRWVAENEPEKQQKRLRCNDLVASAVILQKSGFQYLRNCCPDHHWDSNCGNWDKRGKICKILAYKMQAKVSLASRNN